MSSKAVTLALEDVFAVLVNFCSGQGYVLKLETLFHGVQSAKHTVQHRHATSFNYMNVLRAVGRKLPLICLFLGSDISDYGGLLVQFR